MKSRWNSLAVGGCNVIGLTLLALSVTAGGSAVQAAGDSVVLDSVALEPLMKLADVFQQRIAKIEASVAAVTQSLTTKRVAAQELCVADESGLQTCITKAQLDALLKNAVQAAQAAPSATPASQVASAPASDAEQTACPERCVPSDAAIAAAPTAPPAVKEAAVAREPAAPDASAGAKEAVQPEAPATAVVNETAAGETAAPEGASTVPPATQPAAEHHQAAGEGPAAAEAVIATAAKPEPLIQAESPAKHEASAQTAPATTGSAAQEPTAIPPEAPAVSEHKE